MDRTRRALTLDLEAYLGQLDDWDITQAEKEEWLLALWTILVGFAEMGLGIHPVQRVLSAREGEECDTGPADMVGSDCSVQRHNEKSEAAEDPAPTQGDAPCAR